MFLSLDASCRLSVRCFVVSEYQRSRIVEGRANEPPPSSADEIVRSIEAILAAKSSGQPKRRNRKTHGRISFGDLARSIAEAWKAIDPKVKTIFDHYAEVDMMRYKRELKAWKDKKELEDEAKTVAKHQDFMTKMNQSFSSAGSSSQSTTESILANLPDEGGSSGKRQGEPPAWGHSRLSASAPGGMTMMNNNEFNNSYSSVESSASAFSYEQEPEPMQQIISRQQQILNQMRGSSNLGPTIPNQGPSAAAAASAHQPQSMSMSMMQGGPYGSMQHHGGNASMMQMMQHQQNMMMQQQMDRMGMQSPQQMHYPNMNQPSFHPQQGSAASMMPMMNAGAGSAMMHGGGGGYNNWNGQVGNSSLNSLPANESLFTPSYHGQASQVSDYSSTYNPHASQSNMSTSTGFNSSFASSSMGGFHPADGLAPPSTSPKPGRRDSPRPMRDSPHPMDSLDESTGSGANRRGFS